MKVYTIQIFVGFLNQEKHLSDAFKSDLKTLKKETEKQRKRYEEMEKKEKDYDLLTVKETCPKCFRVEITVTNRSENAANITCNNCTSKFFVDYVRQEAEYIGEID